MKKLLFKFHSHKSKLSLVQNPNQLRKSEFASCSNPLRKSGFAGRSNLLHKLELWIIQISCSDMDKSIIHMSCFNDFLC